MPVKGTWIEQVDKRTRSGKKRVDSADSRHFAIDASIGSIHYWEGEQWKEIDNIFEPVAAPWDWQMVKAGYHIRVKEDFTAGQIIEFEKRGETVQFQPMALEWTNDLDQIQQVSMPQDVTPVVTNPEVDLLPEVGVPSHIGTIKWDDAYGQGIDFEWRCTSTRLVKILEVENLNKLPVPEQYILDGGNPVLRLNLIFDPPSKQDVDIYIDGELWDRKTKKQTFKVIEFRKDGEVLWGFMPLMYWGSNPELEENVGQSVATLEKRGNKLYISIRVPYEWLQNAAYPIFVDTTIEEQVATSASDAYEDDGGGSFTSTASTVRFYSNTSEWSRYNGGMWWDNLAIDQAQTIAVAYLIVNVYSADYDDPNCKIHCNDVDDADDFSETADVTSRVVTTDFASWVATGIGTGWKNSPSIVDPVQEVINRASWVSGNALCVIGKGNSDANKSFYILSYDWDVNVDGPKLHIEYSVAGWTHKYLGVANASIGKISGVAIADIAKVDGVA